MTSKSLSTIILARAQSYTQADAQVRIRDNNNYCVLVHYI